MLLSLTLGLLTVSPAAIAAEVSWWGEAEISYGYDSNVAVDDVDLSTSEGDQYYDLGLSGGIDYEVSKDLKFSFDLTASDKQYRTFDEFDGRLLFASAACGDGGDGISGIAGGALAAARQVVMPQNPCGHGAPGMPGISDGGQILLRGSFPKMFNRHQGLVQSQVTVGPDIRPSQGQQ